MTATVGRATGRPVPLRALLLLLVALTAVSSSAVLVRYTEVPAVALAFWRTAGGALVLLGPALAGGRRPTSRQRWALALAGLALGLHFITWLASLELTSVAASVTLVATAPLFVALAGLVTGRRPSRRTWLALALALAGTAVIAGGDALVGGQALVGDALAVVGAVTVAAYLVVGSRLRASLPTTAYAAWTYLGAAVAVAGVALVGRVPLWGYDTGSWLVIGAMIVGPQLAGHTVLNRLLPELGSVTVSLSLLTEPVVASLLVWVLLAEAPPLLAVIGAPLVLLGLVLQLRSDHRPSTIGVTEKILNFCVRAVHRRRSCSSCVRAHATEGVPRPTGHRR